MTQRITHEPFLIGIAGPSGAGKSVFCKLMQSTFKGVSRLKLDDFFKDIEQVPTRGKWTDWDNPSSIKWEPLIAAARDLKAGSYAMVPNYYRKEDRCIGEKCVFPSSIILVDGFMTLVDKRLRSLLDVSLFFHLSEDSQIKRRKERQPWVEDGYLQEVMLPAAREYVIPSKQFATHIVNAELPQQRVADYCVALVRHELNHRIKKLERRNSFKTTQVKARL